MTTYDEDGWVIDGAVALCPRCKRVREGTAAWAIEHARSCGWRSRAVLLAVVAAAKKCADEECEATERRLEAERDTALNRVAELERKADEWLSRPEDAEAVKKAMAACERFKRSDWDSATRDVDAIVVGFETLRDVLVNECVQFSISQRKAQRALANAEERIRTAEKERDAARTQGAAERKRAND